VAPFSRKASAAIAMDTIDMTFDAVSARGRFVDLPMTDVRSALDLASGVPRPGVQPAQ
jgi:hypothetical protein